MYQTTYSEMCEQQENKSKCFSVFVYLFSWDFFFKDCVYPDLYSAHQCIHTERVNMLIVISPVGMCLNHILYSFLDVFKSRQHNGKASFSLDEVSLT